MKGSNAFLHRHNLLDADDKLIETVVGEFVTMTLDGVEHPMPRGRLIVSTPSPVRMCYCSYSSRRLFFGLPATVAGANLHWLWRMETSATTLTAVFNSTQLQMVRWKPMKWNAEEVAAFAARILARREERIAELPAETRQEVDYWSGQLERRGALEAVLAGPVAEPRTVIGAWLRAGLCGDNERRRELLSGFGKTNWNDDEKAVIGAAFDLLVHRYCGTGPDAAAAVTACLSRLALAKARGLPVDLPEAEGMIRSALAGALPSFGTRREFVTGLALILGIRLELDLYPIAVDWLATRSEQLAFEQGWNPSLLPD